MAETPGGFPADDDELAFAIGEALVARGEKVAVSETTAGGLISCRMLSVAGASRWFESGLVPYSSPTKWEVLGMDREIAREHGAVSPIWVSAAVQVAVSHFASQLEAARPWAARTCGSAA